MNILTSIPSPGISFIELGPFRLHFYALFILTGIVLAVILTSRRLSRRGGEPGIVLDITLWAVPFGIVGGRFYHVITHPNDYFFPGADLWKTLYVWEGGLAIFGAIVFGSLGAYIACRRAGLRFFSFADAVAPGMLLAQVFGRIGNYFNQELFGTPTTLPWGLQIDPSQPAFPAGLPADTLFHPLFLYEMIWNLIGVAVVLLADRRFDLRWGKALGLYLIVYGTGRTWFESFRLDPTEFELLGVKINMITAAVLALAGLVLIIVQSRRHPEPEVSPYLPGREWSEQPRPVDTAHVHHE
ncbi:prolipoprotein diacylglyceryl transferase [Cryobacterium fucosi]|uniref:Phosphatidylglycerol--prolipoprotein diacylglyceryl transferase n=1 Tax=Cryobacterium fucosi TaxID=1259157 RepID=A0A4R9BE97_9MICO|nr:prolipoprotein diacylglyceryl transferase [Cryobacterium fucosi]TFD81583.1 prolipoprotein diacylglyceryl transferase [Cryobacterium fucosi]